MFGHSTILFIHYFTTIVLITCDIYDLDWFLWFPDLFIPLNPWFFVVLGKILQAVEPGAVRNSIAGPAESALTPGVLLPDGPLRQALFAFCVTWASEPPLSWRPTWLKLH